MIFARGSLVLGLLGFMTFFLTGCTMDEFAIFMAFFIALMLPGMGPETVDATVLHPITHTHLSELLDTLSIAEAQALLSITVLKGWVIEESALFQALAPLIN